MKRKEWGQWNYEHCETLAELVAEWRETAAHWERERSRGAGYTGSPVGNGKSNINNWENWLKGCADAVERLTSQEPGGHR